MSMAMSDTGSSFAQWSGLYHHDLSPALLIGPAHNVAADGQAIAGAAAATSPTSGGSSGSPTKQAHQQPAAHGVEGPRAAKPARRRSRASRRAPVTLLNTDTTNFRAMVQQFTGIPAPPAGAFGGPDGVPFINFAGDYGFPPPSGVMSFDHQLHRGHPPAPLQEQLRRQQQYTGATFGYNGLQGGGDVFASVEDRMLLQSMHAAQMPHMPPASAANTSANGYFG